jgi:hypothetical protein
LRGDHAQTKAWSAMAIQPSPIALAWNKSGPSRLVLSDESIG